MHPAIALITLLTVLLLAAMVYLVGKGRARYGIRAPATTGPDGFERIFRVQQNTQEATLMFLPSLWVAANFGLVWISATLGVVWLLARIWYAVAYANPARQRGAPFALGAIATIALVAQGLWGIAWTWILT